VDREVIRRSRRTVRIAGQLAAVVLVAALAAAAPTSAPAATLTGQVVGEPYAAKKRAAVRVLLKARSARRAKLESPIGVLTVAARKVKGPRGKRIAARLLRVNDRFRTRTKVGRRARRAAYWRIGVRTLRVKKRSSVLSAAELQQLVSALRDDLSKLSATVLDLARYTAGGFASLHADLASLRADFSALRSEFTALAAQVAAVGAQLAALEARLAGLGDELQGVRDDVAALSAAVTALGAQLATLQAQVATLTADVAALSATLGSLSGQLGDLTNLGGSVEELLAGVAPGDIAAALADIGTLQADLATLEGVVGGPASGLVQQVNGLAGVVGGADSGLVAAVAALQASDLATASDITALQTSVADAERRLDGLEALVGGPGGLAEDVAALETTVGGAGSGLVQQVNGLQSDVDALCGPGSLLDALC
jgi:prefoldin subunit 5